MIRLADLRCDTCGSPAVVAIAPGSEPIHDMFLLAREIPIRCRCLACWPALQAQQKATTP